MQARSAAAWFSDTRAVATRQGPGIRLGGAIVASVLFHASFLNWQVHVPALGQWALERPPGPVLRVSLRIQPDEPPPVAEPAPRSATAPPPASVEVAKATEASRDKAPVSPAEPPQPQDSMPLAGYYPVSKLTQMPDAISRFDIKAPAGGDTGLGGKLTIRVWINAKGGLDSMKVVANGLPADYAEAALAAFGKLRFSPGQINGVAVPAWADIIIEYADFTRDPPP